MGNIEDLESFFREELLKKKRGSLADLDLEALEMTKNLHEDEEN